MQRMSDRRARRPPSRWHRRRPTAPRTCGEGHVPAGHLVRRPSSPGATSRRRNPARLKGASFGGPVNVRTPAPWDVDDPVERLRAMLRSGGRLWCPLPSEQDQRMTEYLDRKREAEEVRRTGRVRSLWVLIISYEPVSRSRGRASTWVFSLLGAGSPPTALWPRLSPPASSTRLYSGARRSMN